MKKKSQDGEWPGLSVGKFSAKNDCDEFAGKDFGAKFPHLAKLYGVNPVLPER